MLWGMKAVETHSVKKSLGATLSKQTTSEEVMECLDQKTMETSILKLPLRRQMQVMLKLNLYVYNKTCLVLTGEVESQIKLFNEFL